jgi:hypothetical protein
MKYEQSHLIYDTWQAITAFSKVFDILKEQEWKVMDIRRQDVIGLVVSNELAMRTGVYGIQAGADWAQATTIRLDPEAFLQSIAYTNEAYRKIDYRFAGYPHYMKIQYEDMFDPLDEGKFQKSLVRTVSSFLGVQDEFNRTPALQKIGKRNPLDHVENRDEIRALIELKSAVNYSHPCEE